MRNLRVLPIVTALSIACASSFCLADALAPPKQPATPQQTALVPFNSTEWPWKTDPSKGTGPKSFEDLHKSGLL